MTTTLSNWAREFLCEDRVAVISTLNKDGSSHVTAIWYLLADDGTLILTTPARSQKAKNLYRDSRIALCVGGAGCSVSLYGHASISEDQVLVRQDIEQIVERYVKEAGIRPRVVANLMQRTLVALHFLPEKITEFSTLSAGSILS